MSSWRDILCVSAAAAGGFLAARWYYCSGQAKVQSRSVTASGSNVYDTERALHEYLHFHYCPREEYFTFGATIQSIEQCADFPAGVARLVAKLTPTTQRHRVLDIGCAVGRTTFELSRDFEEAVGLDFSATFIKAANLIKSHGSHMYTATEEGTIMRQRTAVLPSGVNTAKVRFVVGDACNLDKGSLGSFDAVIGCNLLCRLPDPQKFLSSMKDMIRSGGVLVLVSPYSWLEEYTAKSKWLSPDPLKHLHLALDDAFVLDEKALGEVGFLIREHRRKFQLGVSHVTVWRRK